MKTKQKNKSYQKDLRIDSPPEVVAASFFRKPKQIGKSKLTKQKQSA
ncbi:MAG: hypothetical protein OXI60_00885 [Acidiferrobacterales bacterium]|nr:hypothetical protein [Acidiferrobacterales bacterium]